MIWFSAYDFPRIKANNWQVGLHKMEKKLLHSWKKPKTTTTNAKKEPTEWERNFASCTSDTEYPNIYRHPSKKVKETNDTDMGYAFD